MRYGRHPFSNANVKTRQIFENPIDLELSVVAKTKVWRRREQPVSLPLQVLVENQSSTSAFCIPPLPALFKVESLSPYFLSRFLYLIFSDLRCFLLRWSILVF